MILSIGERIRELRRDRALTQEEVARRLNISAQAVSKWENSVSYPDLELIPPLAELLGVSIDALFRAETETAAEESCRRADALLLSADTVREALPMLREAVIRHPFHAGLLRRLGMALFLSYRLPEDLGKCVVDEHGKETVITHGDPGLLREAVAAYERALNCEKQPDERDLIVKNLTLVYTLAGQQENARMFASQQSRLAYAREMMLMDVETGEQKDEAVATALLALLKQTAVAVLTGTPSATGAQADADDIVRIIHAERCVSTAKYIESFFPDGRCGNLHFVLAQLWYYPSALYAALGDYSKADVCFVPMTRHEQANRAYGEGGEYRYTGPLFGKIVEQEPKYVKYEPTKQPLTEEYKAHIRETPELAKFLN